MKIEKKDGQYFATYKHLTAVAQKPVKAIQTILHALDCSHATYRTYAFLREKKCRNCGLLVIDEN